MPTAKAKPPSIFSAVLTRPQPIVQGKPLSELLPPAVPNRPLGQDALVDIGDFIGGAIGTADPFGPTSSKAVQLGALVGSSLPVLAGIRAFHGSPHKFSKFSLGKIGTGEGAQSYGRGLYFAEAEQVAKNYKTTGGPSPYVVTLKNDPLFDPLTRDLNWAREDGIPTAFDELTVDDMSSMEFLAALVDEADYRGFGNIDSADPAARTGAIRDYIKHLRSETLSKSGLLKLDGVTEILDKYGKDLQVGRPSRGHLYEVDIDADPSDLLDWDAPLPKQSPRVLERVLGPDIAAKIRQHESLTNKLDEISSRSTSWHKAHPEVMKEWDSLVAERNKLSSEIAQSAPIPRGKPWMKATGRDIYENLYISTGRSEADVSDLLKSRGVPGIKYWDGMSRRNQAGTRNFVIFDDSIIDILKQTGILLPVTGAAISSLNRYGPGPAPQQR